MQNLADITRIKSLNATASEGFWYGNFGPVRESKVVGENIAER